MISFYYLVYTVNYTNIDCLLAYKQIWLHFDTHLDVYEIMSYKKSLAFVLI